MKDRFKFRVWNKEIKQYIDYGQWLSCDIELNFNPFTKEVWCEFDDSQYIVEQCTGLKDKNGKLIYEGDIIRKENQRFIIKYDFDSFKAYDKEKRPISIYGLFTFKICSCGFPEKETENTIEVIGNIHENKDLLDQEDE